MWPIPQLPANLFTFTEEIFNGKLPFYVQWELVLSSLYFPQKYGQKMCKLSLYEVWKATVDLLFAKKIKKFSTN